MINWRLRRIWSSILVLMQTRKKQSSFWTLLIPTSITMSVQAATTINSYCILWEKIKFNFRKVCNFQLIKFNNGPCYTLCPQLFLWKIKSTSIGFSMMRLQWKMWPCSSDKKMLMIRLMRIFSNSARRTNKHSSVVLLISQWSFIVALRAI